jgi:hypothetical protein
MATRPTVEVQELSEAEASEQLDAAARKYLGISGDEFAAKWERGDFADRSDDPAVIRVSLLLPPTSA